MKNKLTCLDGIKVMACMMVFNFHFINFYYPGIYSLLEENYHVASVEHIFGTTPLTLLVAAKFAVRIFMVLSGFLVGYRFFTAGDKKSLQTGAVKKYFRLAPPIAVVSVLIFILMKVGLYQNGAAAAKAGSTVFMGNYNQFVPSFFGALYEAFIGCFVSAANAYNGPVWFITYEFFGTLLVAAILSLFGESRIRYVVYALAAVLCIRYDFLGFIFGDVVCDLTYQPPIWVERISAKKPLMWLALMLGLFLGSFPSIGERLEGTIYGWMPTKVMFYFCVGAAMMLYAVLHLEAVQKALSIGFFTWFSQYTYSFYLLHFPVLCTFSSILYLTLADEMNYHLLALANYILSVILTALLAYLLHITVEKPSIKLAAKIGGLL